MPAILQRKYGPLTGLGWALVIGALAFALILYRRRGERTPASNTEAFAGDYEVPLLPRSGAPAMEPAEYPAPAQEVTTSPQAPDINIGRLIVRPRRPGPGGKRAQPGRRRTTPRPKAGRRPPIRYLGGSDARADATGGWAPSNTTAPVRGRPSTIALPHIPAYQTTTTRTR